MSTQAGGDERSRRAGRAFLPEVQALRMWAVGLVVAFHLWPDGWFPGGFVGVDAFFVVSGFLITSHLVREVEATGRVRLAAFYARRARRLLPAALLVLLVTAALTVALLPQDTWADVAAEIVASAFYVQNLWLASQAVTYSASTAAPSPVQHYWSLSAEEQFYLVWPSLVLLALWLSRRRQRRRPVVAIGAVLTVVALASFVCSLLWTRTDQAAAYFVTPTRAWEFAAGAILPMVLRRWAPSPTMGIALRYGGLITLLASARLLTQATPFPGWAALAPVLGTAAVVLAGDCGGRDPLERVFTHRVTQWLGGISYSIYLWHWPLVVVAPYVVGGEPQLRDLLVVAALTLALAHLSARYVEDLTRLMPRVRRSSRRALLAALAGSLAATLAGTCLAAAATWVERQRAATLLESAGGSCAGGRAGIRLRECPDAFTRPPAVSVGTGDIPWKRVEGCTGGYDPFVECRWGQGAPTRTVALVGDSHAEHYSAALHTIARQRGWRLLVFVKQRCPAVDADVPAFLGRARKDPGECRAWAQEVTARMRQEGVSLVLTSAYASASPVAGGDPDGAYQRVWDAWAAYADVVVLRDTPGTGERDMPACLKQHADDPRACSYPRDKALPPDQMSTAAAAGTNRRVHLVDLSAAYCDATTCYGVGGGLPVYMDRNHVAYGYMQTLAPVIASQLPR